MASVRPDVYRKQHCPKVALITGVTGQDGSYLAELLLEKGYIVHGIKRRASSFNQERVEHLFLDTHEHRTRFFMHYGDVMDLSNLINILRAVVPDEIYNLAAQSHVAVSFEMPIYTGRCDGLGTMNLLEAIRGCGMEKTCKFYQASTSELYGATPPPQDENTPFYPRSPYAVAKLYAYWAVVNYREAYGMYACNGILFNHESPRRGETFLTRKVTMAVGRIKAGMQKCVYLGNLDSKRDWGHAKDYVEGMWRMLQTDEPEDFVLATGEYHTVREFCEIAFQQGGMTLRFEGKGVDETGIDVSTGNIVVKVDPRYFRPTEVDALRGSPAKAQQKLGWKCEFSFEALVKDMVDHDTDYFAMKAKEASASGTFRMESLANDK